MQFQLRGTIFSIMAISILASGSILAQDRGAPDSVILEMRVEGEITNPQRFELDLYVVNDSNNIASMSVKFAWDNPSIRMDSANSTELAKDAFNFLIPVPGRYDYFTPPEIANEHLQLAFGGSRISGVGLAHSPGRQLLGTAYFSVLNWSTPDCVCFDTTKIGGNSGVKFVDGSLQVILPVWSGPICFFTGEDSDTDGVGNACQLCCDGTTGNIDCDAQEIIDVTDLTVLVDHMFVTLEPLCCAGEGNIDGDAMRQTGLADLTWLIDHLFIAGTAVADCR